jgi:adenine-specific DNA-methyltransferase
MVNLLIASRARSIVPDHKWAYLNGDCRDILPRLHTPIDCVVTDPPFGVDNSSNNYRRADSARFNEKIANDKTVDAALEIFDGMIEALMPNLADQAEVYVFSAWTVGDIWKQYLENIPGLELKMKLIWYKGYPGQGDLEGNWGCGYEEIFYLKKGRRKVPYRRSAILEFDRVPGGKNFHPHQKPVNLLQTLIEFSTDPGGFVVDPFAGSGSTVKAAYSCGRNALGIELDPKYRDHAIDWLGQESLFGE